MVPLKCNIPVLHDGSIRIWLLKNTYGHIVIHQMWETGRMVGLQNQGVRSKAIQNIFNEMCFSLHLQLFFFFFFSNHSWRLGGLMNDMYHVLKLGRWDILLLQKLKCNKKRSIEECYRKELVLKTPTLTLAQGCLLPLQIVAPNLAEAPLDAFPWEEQRLKKSITCGKLRF